MPDTNPKICIYCAESKAANEFSLEHVVPQFLGGAQMPDRLKTRDVCKKCNNNLGLFVDAAFEKDFLVFNQLTQIAHDFFNPSAPSGLPLLCMGSSDLTPPDMASDEVCELWLGPLGELVFWIRPEDKRLFWYSGGNPRTVKQLSTTAYFFASERSLKNPMLTWSTFHDAFVGRRVRKIMGTGWGDADPASIGFVAPNEHETRVLTFLWENCSNGQGKNQRVSMHLDYDKRFMAKLALGVSHALWGSAGQGSEYMQELRKGLWFRDGDKPPSIYGRSSLSQQDDFLRQLVGFKNGVTITLMPMPEGVVLNLNIRQQMHWVVVCAQLSELSSEQLDALGDGLCFVLFRPLKKVIELSLPELVAHNSGNIAHNELAQVESLAGKQNDYFATL